MPTSFRATWKGDKDFLASLRRAVSLTPTVAVGGVGAAAIRTQAAIRRHLTGYVYLQPSKSGYVRTRTLYRSVHAAPPGANHSGDEGAARSGQDLAAHDPRQAAAMQGGAAVSEVGSHVSYADYVHSGARGVRPRPFVDAAEDEAERMLVEELEKAIQRAFR